MATRAPSRPVESSRPDVNGQEQLELLAGHHRIRALEEWMKLANLGEKELWWPCKFYDRGKLA
ncbi:hypothetical protein E4U33_001134 [Claviceps sp. LM78 group G4]|nr:hypothetical protein E4U33_001134 [Claviceps sp. LM78 group G4]